MRACPTPWVWARRASRALLLTPPACPPVRRHQLEQEVAVEDPFCGEIVARHVSKPFILPEESAAIESWAV